MASGDADVRREVGPTRRLRVAFVADTLHAPIGGGVTSGARVVERLRRYHDVQVIGADAPGEGDVRLPGFVIPVHAMKAMHFVMARPVRKELDKAIAEADVVHLQFPFWLSFAALSAARRANKPVVAGFHVQPENALHNVGIWLPVINDVVYRLWVDHLYSHAACVVCPSPFAERKLRSYGLAAKTAIISNGIPDDITPNGPNAREPEHEGSFVIVTLGRLASEKRQSVVIEAVRRSRNARKIKLVVAGTGPLEAQLKDLAKTLPNGAEVGFLPRERLLQLLRSADLFVHASEVELEGIAVMEAIGSGLPVIVADAPESAAKDFALDDDFRFPAGNVRKLAQRIDALIEAPDLLRAARTRYLERAPAFDFGECAKQLAMVYDDVVRAAHPKTSNGSR
ncbi:Glycosyltransferase [Labilithrix luteola]|uniref:Glycosyltransferase n=1 Tax=Labilithrix luteola TaxID=1391654 RepID=A0A0K1QAJ4_9BACT|nr:glycosyltransferase [Labilithrix luteola]AKV02743.1 Glycosyltransferase [Labilithrix luteola]